MKLFKQKETFTENIAFMGIMAGVNLVICLLSAGFPFVSIILGLVLPLVSTLVEVYCKDKYYIIYAVSTFALSLVATLWNFSITVFYLLPSLVTGFIFGYISKKKYPAIWNVLLASICHATISIVTLPVINILFGIDLIEAFKVFLKLDASQLVDIIVPMAILAISMMQVALAYFLTINELRKLGVEDQEPKTDLAMHIVSFIAALLIIPMYFLSLRVAYVLLAISLYFMVYFIFVDLSKISTITLLFYVVSLLLGTVFSVIIGHYLKEGSALLSIALIPFLVTLSNFLLSILNKRENKE